MFFDELKVNCFTNFDNTMYVGTDKGIFFSTDNGKSWGKININQKDYNVISLDVKLPQIVFSYWDGNTTGGIFYSQNSGISWRLLDKYMPPINFIKSVMFNNEIIYAAMGDGIYRLQDLNKSSEGWVGIYISGKDNYSSITLAKSFGYAFDANSVYNGGFNSWGAFASRPGYYDGIIQGILDTPIGLLILASNTYNGKIFRYTYDGINRKTDELTNGLDVSQKFSICDGDSGIFLSTDSTLYVSNNYGNNWLSLKSIVKNIKPKKLFFFNKNIFLSEADKGLWSFYTQQISFPKCKLTLETNPPNSGTTIGASEYKFGISIKINTFPNNTNVFLNWTENGKIVSTKAEFNYQIGNDTKLIANFLVPPNEPIASNPESLTQTTFKAVWQEVNTATGYLLDVAIDENFNNILSSYNKKDVKNVKAYIVTGLNKETTFYYRVKAYNIAGVSEKYSNIISVKTLPNPPVAPTSKVATDVTLNSFTANWNPVSGAIGYIFDLAIDDKFANTLSAYKNKDVGNSTNLSLSGLVSNMDYYYRVKAYNTGGSSGYSNTIKVGLFVDIEKQKSVPTEFNLLQNYPNPFNPETKIRFDIPKECFVKLHVYDVLGNEVASLVNKILLPATYNINFNASKLNNGVYFYRLDTDGFTQTKKMIFLK